mmetsp:Transcript_91113/g.262450  ORF Transcript_91113/g.262450 Transcript_91113/m.262450 type:complete len:212 (+) Transcript_91113:141-776(+)
MPANTCPSVASLPNPQSDDNAEYIDCKEEHHALFQKTQSSISEKEQTGKTKEQKSIADFFGQASKPDSDAMKIVSKKAAPNITGNTEDQSKSNNDEAKKNIARAIRTPLIHSKHQGRPDGLSDSDEDSFNEMETVFLTEKKSSKKRKSSLTPSSNKGKKPKRPRIIIPRSKMNDPKGKCKCKKGCGNHCGCRKKGNKCSLSCECKGRCNNK